MMPIGVALDRALGIVAPRWAAQRMVARGQMLLLRRSLRALEATRPGRTSARKTYPRQGPNEKARSDLEATRAQARDLYRRNAYARGAVNSIVANLIGTGIRPQARAWLRTGRPNKEWNDLAEEIWKEWGEAADVSGRESIYEIQQQVQREAVVAGEVLIRKSIAPDSRIVPLAVDVIASERLAYDKEEARTPSGGKIVQGVEFDAAGRIVRYWIYPNHPYDGGVFGADKPVATDAREILHFYSPLEPGQVRGLTRFETIAGACEGFTQWLDWVLTKERVASAFALMIAQQGGTIQLPGTFIGNQEGEVDEQGEEIDQLEGGMIFHGKPGETLQGVSSNVQASAVDQLAVLFLRILARGLDVSYELLARDLTKVTYLSARVGENQDRRHWEPQQESLNRRVNRPIWREFVRAGVLVGAIPVRGDVERYLEVDFIRPGFPWVDPLKEVEADVTGIQAGLESPQAVIMRRGGDPEQILRDTAAFRDAAKELGLELSIFAPPAPKAGAPAAGQEPGAPNDAGE